MTLQWTDLRDPAADSDAETVGEIFHLVDIDW